MLFMLLRTESNPQSYETRLHWIVYVSLKALLTLFIDPLIARATSVFAITNNRIIIKVGLMYRHTLEMNLLKVESGGSRHLGAFPRDGSITVIGTGGTNEPFTHIANPIEFRKQFQQLQA